MEKILNENVMKRGRGEWVMEDGLYTCSECGKTAPYSAENGVITYWPKLRFCPFCGSKMNLRKRKRK